MVLGFAENEWVQWVHWSPDGRRLAYVRVRRSSDKFQRWIETCDLKGTSPRVVVPDADVFLPDFWWLPEGRIVYARQESHGSSDSNVWEIGVDNHAGTPTGTARRITQGPDLTSAI